MTPLIERLEDAAALAERTASWLLQEARAAPGLFALCLSGGSTPKALYQRLAQEPFRSAFPWEKTHFFWGDERFVPKDDPQSNFGMVKTALLYALPIAAEQVHAPPTQDVSPQAAAQAYQETLQTFYGAERLDPARPLFDVVLLGLGPDGHTASLFPGSAVLQEQERWVAPVIGIKSETRLTLTYPPLQSARTAAFLVQGSDKRAILAELLAGGDVPAARLHPVGALRIFADRAAAPEER